MSIWIWCTLSDHDDCVAVALAEMTYESHAALDCRRPRKQVAGKRRHISDGRTIPVGSLRLQIMPVATGMA